MKKLKFITTIEARMTSTRLPGKVLKRFKSDNPKYDNLTCLKILIDRIRESKYVSTIIIATSVNNTDDEIEIFCKENKINCFRGSEFDVLGRLSEAVKSTNKDYVIQLTGDNPFIDPRVIDYVVRAYIKEYPRFDYVTNNGLMQLEHHEIPLGMDVSVFAAQKLIDNALLAKEAAFREHPGLFFYKNNSNMYNVLNVPIPNQWKRRDKNIRLTFDTEEDFQLLQTLYDYFSKTSNKFSLEEILTYLDKNKHLLEINVNTSQKIPVIK